MVMCGTHIDLGAAPIPLGIAHAFLYILRGARRNPCSFVAKKEKRGVRREARAMHAIVVAFLFQIGFS
jgi:hypothetical protein